MTVPAAPAAIDLLALARGVSMRMGELVLVTPTTNGSTTTIICTTLNQQLPNDIPAANWWVYGCSDVVASNRGVERRVRSWAQTSSTLTFHSGGAAWPASTTTAGTYELRTRNSRSRVVAAITEAVQMLALSWDREFEDTSITTVTNQWRYTLPASANWSSVNRVEIELNTDPTLTGYPYVNAMTYGLNWKAERSVTTAGVETWELQFGTLPPPDRTLRVFGRGFMPAPVLDTDVLSISGQWYGPVVAFVNNWAVFCLNDWMSNAIPGGEVQRYMGRASTLRKWANDLRDEMHQPNANAPVNVPGAGDGNITSNYWSEIGYFGALGNLH